MTHQQMAAIFNEWARRYAENPDEFDSILDANGKPVEDYGQRCALYFDQIAQDMGAVAALPNSAEREACAKVRASRDALREAMKMRCTCSGFVIQYEGGCVCARGKARSAAEGWLTQAIDAL